MDTSEKIICPSFTVWIIFITNLVLFYSNLINGNYIYYEYYKYSAFQFFSLLINCIIELISSVLVTISFEKKNIVFIYQDLL